MARQYRLAITGLADGHGTALVQPARKRQGEVFRHVLHNQHRRRIGYGLQQARIFRFAKQQQPCAEFRQRLVFFLGIGLAGDAQGFFAAATLAEAGGHLDRLGDRILHDALKDRFPATKLFTVEDKFGSWEKVMKEHFAAGAEFDRLVAAGRQ
jgi:hypothetical protein